MEATEIMTRNVVTVMPDATIREAARLMGDLDVGALPVCDGRRLLGIITDRDIVVRATADGMQPDRTSVRVVMTDDVCWCYEDDPVEEIQQEMSRRQIRRMPVLDGRDRRVGMVNLGDLAEENAPEADRTLRSISMPAELDRRRPGRAIRRTTWPPLGGFDPS